MSLSNRWAGHTTVINPELPRVLAAGQEGYFTATGLRVVGDGVTVVSGLPAMAVAGGVPISFASGVRPALHMATFVAAASPVVAMIGDSVSVGVDTLPSGVSLEPAALAQPVTESEVFWEQIKRRIREDNPHKAVTFKNFAVSGQGWTQLSGVASANHPTWYTNTGSAWLSYVEAASPDLIIIALGANDQNGLTAYIVKQALVVIDGWAKVPDIILVTPWRAYLGGGVTELNWASQMRNGAFIRGLCQSGPGVLGLSNLPQFGLIDLSRWQQIVEDGADPADQYLSLSLEDVERASGGNYTLPEHEGDFSLTVKWPGVAGVFKFPGMTLDISGYAGKTYANIYNNGGTGVGARVDYSGSTLVSTTASTSGAVTDGTKDITLEIAVRNSHIRIACNGTYFFDRMVPRFSGPFAPAIAPYSASTNAYTIVKYCVGRKVATLSSPIPKINSVGSLGGIFGGNGNNHPSSLGLYQLHQQVLNRTTFS